MDPKLFVSQDDDDDDDFVDAQDGDPSTCCHTDKANSSNHDDDDDDNEAADLTEALQEAATVLKLALNNELVKALDICSRKAHKELYASLITAALSFLRASLTLNQADLKAAVLAINQSFEVSSRRRRKHSMVMRFIYRPNYNNYSDYEIHAELVHAESLLLLALVSFIADQSIICLMKGAFRIRTCYQRYKECLYIMENRREWASPEAKRHFYSGVRMGHGIFNMLMSYLPRRVLRFLEYVGFSGNRNLGQDELDRSIAMNDGLRSVFSSLCILVNNCYVETLFGLGNYDLDLVNKLTTSRLQDYPNSAFFLIFLGRYYQMQGRLGEAIDSFQRCIDAQNDWIQIHSICHWEMMWCYAVQMDWAQALVYADLLRKHSRWSPSSYTYMYATFLYSALVEDERSGTCAEGSAEHCRRMDEIRCIMEEVPKLKIRYAGKTIPAEKFAITRAVKFCAQNNRLSLPALEFLYIWNIFCVLKNCPSQVEKILARIDSEIGHIESMAAKESGEQETKVEVEDDGEGQSTEEEHEQSSVENNWDDDLSLMFLLKGMCMKHLNRLPEAEDCFRSVIDKESDIISDSFLVPHSAMELSCLKLTLKQYDEAKLWIKTARNNYTHYLHETIVHFKLHAASRAIRAELHDHLLSSSTESTESGGEHKLATTMTSIEAS